MINGFKVLAQGLQATIQDSGRKGYGDIGVTEAGVMDEYAYHWANKLLGNEYGTNTIEVAFGGLKLQAVGLTHFVVTGANVNVKVGGKLVPCWKTHRINDGEILEIAFATLGQRIYLSVLGGYDIESEFGSCSTSVKEGIGGIKGRALQKDDFIPFTPNKLTDNRLLPKSSHPDYESELTLRLVAGYQWDMFSKEEREKFFSNSYDVTNQSDRMGFRLSGEKIKADKGGIVSEPIAYGSVQIPSHGEPIVLLKERQTIGGYPKIGSVIPIDCFKLSQMKQGSKVRFKQVSHEEARVACKGFYEFFS